MVDNLFLQPGFRLTPAKQIWIAINETFTNLGIKLLSTPSEIQHVHMLPDTQRFSQIIQRAFKDAAEKINHYSRKYGYDMVIVIDNLDPKIDYLERGIDVVGIAGINEGIYRGEIHGFFTSNKVETYQKNTSVIAFKETEIAWHNRKSDDYKNLVKNIMHEMLHPFELRDLTTVDVKKVPILSQMSSMCFIEDNGWNGDGQSVMFYSYAKHNEAKFTQYCVMHSGDALGLLDQKIIKRIGERANKPTTATTTSQVTHAAPDISIKCDTGKTKFFFQIESKKTIKRSATETFNLYLQTDKETACEALRFLSLPSNCQFMQIKRQGRNWQSMEHSYAERLRMHYCSRSTLQPFSNTVTTTNNSAEMRNPSLGIALLIGAIVTGLVALGLLIAGLLFRSKNMRDRFQRRRDEVIGTISEEGGHLEPKEQAERNCDFDDFSSDEEIDPLTSENNSLQIIHAHNMSLHNYK